MANNLHREIVKITLVGENSEERQKIKNVFTKKTHFRNAVIVGEHGAHDFGSKYFSKEDEEYFQKCGFKVNVIERFRRRGVEKIAGMSVIVRAKNLTSYNTGCTVSIMCTGETIEELENAKSNVEFRMLNLLNVECIPANRMCIESNLACVYKYR